MARNPYASNLRDISVVLKRETQLAVLVDHGGEEDAWLPKSQIEIERNDDGKTHTLTAPEWLLSDKGII